MARRRRQMQKEEVQTEVILEDGPESDGFYLGEDGEGETSPDLQNIFAAEYRDACDYIDTDIAPMREQALGYYMGLPFGDEEDGRSGVIITETRDKIQAMMPGVLRVFTSGEKTVLFQPTGPEDVEQAEQATDYVNYVLDADGNSAFTTYHDAFKDALMLKAGIITWGWCDKTTVTEHEWEGLTQEQLQALAMDPELEITEIEQQQGDVAPEVAQAIEAATAAGDQEAVATLQQGIEVFYDVEGKRTRKKGHIYHRAIPPEQFIISRDATSVDDATLVGERRLATTSELIEMGYDPQAVRDRAGQVGVGINVEADVRNPSAQQRAMTNSRDGANDRVLYVNVLMRVDADGDGIAELRNICAIGDDLLVVRNEVADEVNYALLCPNPTPHSVFGLSVADDTMDLQEIKSKVMRDTLDSMTDQVFPTTVILDNAVETADVLNTERGRVIREKVQGAVRTLVEPFLGQQALGVMEYLDGISAARTGVTPASQGLDPDVLQSTTRAAVTATVSAAQDRLEMICRIFAHTGLARFYKGILRTLIRHQDKPRMIRLRGTWVAMDPREWNADMDVVPVPGLGRGDEEQRIATLMMIAAKQEQILAQYGPGNPLVTVAQYRETLAEIIRLGGYKNASRFFNEISPEVEQQLAQAAASAQPQDPNILLAQVERDKILADIEIAKQKQQLEFIKAKAEDDRARDEMWANIYLKAAELQGKFGVQVDMAKIQAEVERDRGAQQVQSQERVALDRNARQAAVQEAVGRERAAAAAQRPAGTGVQ